MNRYLVKLSGILDQKRLARWGKRVLYHGTADANVAKVKAKGLIPNKVKADNFFAEATYGGKLQTGTVYLTSDPRSALRYRGVANAMDRYEKTGKKPGHVYSKTNEFIRKGKTQYGKGNKNIGIVGVKLPAGKVKTTEDGLLKRIRDTEAKMRASGNEGYASDIRKNIRKMRPEIETTFVAKGRIPRKYIVQNMNGEFTNALKKRTPMSKRWKGIY